MQRPKTRPDETCRQTPRVWTSQRFLYAHANARGEVVTGATRIPKPASFTQTNPPSKGK